jgi:hypothetical protein
LHKRASDVSSGSDDGDHGVTLMGATNVRKTDECDGSYCAVTGSRCLPTSMMAVITGMKRSPSASACTRVRAVSTT